MFMTLKLAKRLQERQASKVTFKGLNILMNERRVSPKVLREIFIRATDLKILGLLAVDFHMIAMKKENVEIVGFLNRCASQKFNSNEHSRAFAIATLRDLAKNGRRDVWKGLLLGSRDLIAKNRRFALEGLKHLAEKGETQIMSGLIKASSDKDASCQELAVHSLLIFAIKGNAETLPGLINGAHSSELETRILALQGLTDLAVKGNKQAIKYLEEEKK